MKLAGKLMATTRSKAFIFLLAILFFGIAIQTRELEGTLRSFSDFNGKDQKQKVSPSVDSTLSEELLLLRPAEQNETLDSACTTVVRYVGQFGFGHRLSKLSGAFYLAQQVWIDKVALFQVQFGRCEGIKIDIFEHLFGMGSLKLARTLPLALEGDACVNTTGSKVVLIRNDVLGFYGGQNYKVTRRQIPHYFTDQAQSPWLQKMNSDIEIFDYMVQNFRGRQALREFQTANDFAHHTVIGLHLRLGNGEGTNFVESKRAVANVTSYVQNTVTLIQNFLKAHPPPKPPLLFVATDQASVIPILQQAAPEMPTLAYTQPRVSADKGVSFSAWREGSKCMDGWYFSFMDMSLLSEADVVVAGMKSTFTQILPLARVFGRPKKLERYAWKFCEVGGQEEQQQMSCFRTREEWLFRIDPTSIQTVGMIKPLDTLFSRDLIPVKHSILLHLPDVDPEPQIERAETFLIGNKSGVHIIGSRFNQKYRGANQSWDTDEWTWIDP